MLLSDYAVITYGLYEMYKRKQTKTYNADQS